MIEKLEEANEMVAKLVVFIRGMCICPLHQHVDVVLMTHDGPVQWHGPACEVPAEGVGPWCEFVQARTELLDEVYEGLGTRDMTEYLLG